MTKVADEFAAIKANMDKIRAERVAAIQGEPAEAPKPEDVDVGASVWGNFTIEPIDYMGFGYPHER